MSQFSFNYSTFNLKPSDCMFVVRLLRCLSCTALSSRRKSVNSQKTENFMNSFNLCRKKKAATWSNKCFCGVGFNEINLSFRNELLCHYASIASHKASLMTKK